MYKSKKGQETLTSRLDRIDSNLDYIHKLITNIPVCVPYDDSELISKINSLPKENTIIPEYDDKSLLMKIKAIDDKIGSIDVTGDIERTVNQAFITKLYRNENG